MKIWILAIVGVFLIYQGIWKPAVYCKQVLCNATDEVYLKSCDTLKQLKNEIKQSMIYYNNYRYEWNIKKMTPVQYEATEKVFLILKVYSHVFCGNYTFFSI